MPWGGETLEKRNAVRAWLHEHGYAIAHVTIDADDCAYNAPFVRCAQKNDAATLAALRARRRGPARRHLPLNGLEPS